MLSDPQCKDDNVRFTTVLLKSFSEKMWKIKSFFWLEKRNCFCEFLHCFLFARNAQVTFEEKSQTKMNRLEIQIAVFA